MTEKCRKKEIVSSLDRLWLGECSYAPTAVSAVKRSFVVQVTFYPLTCFGIATDCCSSPKLRRDYSIELTGALKLGSTNGLSSDGVCILMAFNRASVQGHRAYFLVAAPALMPWSFNCPYGSFGKDARLYLPRGLVSLALKTIVCVWTYVPTKTLFVRLSFHFSVTDFDCLSTTIWFPDLASFLTLAHPLLLGPDVFSVSVSRVALDPFLLMKQGLPHKMIDLRVLFLGPFVIEIGLRQKEGPTTIPNQLDAERGDGMLSPYLHVGNWEFQTGDNGLYSFLRHSGHLPDRVKLSSSEAPSNLKGEEAYYSHVVEGCRRSRSGGLKKIKDLLVMQQVQDAEKARLKLVAAVQERDANNVAISKAQGEVITIQGKLNKALEQLGEFEKFASGPIYEQELGIPLEHPSWKEAPPEAELMDPLQAYSLLVLPDFNEAEMLKEETVEIWRKQSRSREKP
ncbi:hypothetical protein Acr_00g0095810 [Actinidia rufa]|uniref:Uncharacterized protein n=1 Tax=Actinidia rufa TaxID=165716 RepID=A0A7J0DZK5_9ERIC|nr:hypothetical protein Acr_00g0095810 [Actinidia rufa]